jgi:integrase
MARPGGKDRGIVEKPKGSGKWWVRLFVNGREKRYRAENKSQAKALYGRLKAEIREGRYFPEKFAQQKAVTLRAWLTRYLEGAAPHANLINETRYARRWTLLLGNRLLASITTEDLRHIQAMMKHRRTKLQARTNKPPRAWSDSTINRHLSFLRHVLALAVKDGLMPRNPVSGLRFFPEATRTRFFTDAELAKMRALVKPADWQIIAVAVETGLRRGELFRLRWEHVNLENGVIVLPMPKGRKTRFFGPWTVSPDRRGCGRA